MPADVVARIDDALRVAAGPSNVVPITAARGRARHASARHRRFATGLAAAAAVAVALIGGLAVVQNLGGVGSTGEPSAALDSGAESDRGAGDGGAVAPTLVPQAPPIDGGPVVFSTGTNYGLNTLAQFRQAVPAVPAPTTGSTKSGQQASDRGAGCGRRRALLAPERPGHVARLPDRHHARSTLAGRRRWTTPSSRAAPHSIVLVLPHSPELAAGGAPGPGTVVVVGPDCGVSGADVKAAVPTE